MSKRSDIFERFFRIAKPELLISKIQRSKDMLTELGMNHDDIVLINAIAQMYPSLLRKELFETDVHEIDKNRLVNTLSEYFAKNKIKELIEDICEALLRLNDGKESIIRSNECVYIGNVKNGIPDGPGVVIDIFGDVMCGEFDYGYLYEGIKIWNNGDIYQGEFFYIHNDIFELNGKLGFALIFEGEIHLTDERTFKGIFVGNIPDYGELFWPNGNHFIGDLYLPELYDGSLEMYEGTLEFSNGDIYKGDFENDEFSGEGTLVTSQEIFTGEFDCSEFTYGCIYMMDGCVYVGGCDCYKPHGHGIWYCNKWHHPSDGIIEGDFEYGLFKKGSELVNLHDLNNISWDELNKQLLFEDVFHKNAIIDDEGIYRGDIDHGLPNGVGTFYRYDGITITGYFIDGEPDGCVEIQYDNGETYYGEITDFKLEGYGEYNFDDWTRYVGEFSNNMPHGKGTIELYKRDILSGEFIKGELISGYLKSACNNSTHIEEFSKYDSLTDELNKIHMQIDKNKRIKKTNREPSYKPNLNNIEYMFDYDEYSPCKFFYCTDKEGVLRRYKWI